jgi:hypothetical protein
MSKLNEALFLYSSGVVVLLWLEVRREGTGVQTEIIPRPVGTLTLYRFQSDWAR